MKGGLSDQHSGHPTSNALEATPAWKKATQRAPDSSTRSEIGIFSCSADDQRAIFFFLPIAESVTALASTCKAFRRLLDDHTVRSLAETRFPSLSSVFARTPTADPRRAYHSYAKAIGVRFRVDVKIARENLVDFSFHVQLTLLRPGGSPSGFLEIDAQDFEHGGFELLFSPAFAQKVSYEGSATSTNCDLDPGIDDIAEKFRIEVIAVDLRTAESSKIVDTNDTDNFKDYEDETDDKTRRGSIIYYHDCELSSSPFFAQAVESDYPSIKVTLHEDYIKTEYDDGLFRVKSVPKKLRVQGMISNRDTGARGYMNNEAFIRVLEGLFSGGLFF